eukprot:1412490-Pyramimonas_sp.AAC.1
MPDTACRMRSSRRQASFSIRIVATVNLPIGNSSVGLPTTQRQSASSSTRVGAATRLSSFKKGVALPQDRRGAAPYRHHARGRPSPLPGRPTSGRMAPRRPLRPRGAARLSPHTSPSSS